MARKERSEIPAGMQKVYGRFERWRRSQTGRKPIPEQLWVAAVEAAGEHGVFRTAKVLRLDYVKLKQRVQLDEPRSRSAVPRFVELVGSGPGTLSECVIELEGPRGKMRIEWKGITPPDLAGLSRTLWEPS